jgi:class 3 adenylate cyclase
MRTMRLSLIGLKVSLLGSLLTLGILWAMASLLLQRAEQALVAQVTLQAENYARSAREALLPKPDPFALHFATQSQLKEEAVASAEVLNAQGRILSHTDPARIGGQQAAPRAHGPLSSSAVAFDGGYEISAPISAGDRLIGLVTLKVTRLSLARALGGARHQIWRLAWLAAGLNLVGATLLVGWMMRPIPRLAEAAAAIGVGDYDARVVHKTRDELGLLASAFNVMAAGLAEREKMRSMFGKFVPPEVVEKLVKDGAGLGGGVRREVTVLMADIRDFTQLSETLPPEQLLSFLNDYFSRMVEIIVRHGGCVDKFMGDGILAVFGAPAPLEDHAARAATCALEMHFCLERLNAERSRGGLAPIRFGVALNTGPAVAGMVGSKDKMEYTVVGDTVNTVSRLEGLNSKLGTEILVTESVYLQTCDLFSYEGIGRIQVRGRTQAVGVFQLLGPGVVPPKAVVEILEGLETPVPAVPFTARRRASVARA